MEDSSCHMESDTCGWDLVCFLLGNRAGVTPVPFPFCPTPNSLLSASLYVSSGSNLSPVSLSLLVGPVCVCVFYLHSYQGLSDEHGLLLSLQLSLYPQTTVCHVEL